MSGGSSCREDLEIRLYWEPMSYWMPIEDEPVSKDSTRGIDLLDPSLETVKDGVWLLCSVHACMSVERSFIVFTSPAAHLGWVVVVGYLALEGGFCTLVLLGHALASEMICRISGELNLATPHL